MKVYAIFSGGGVKDAALTGCLQAVQDKHIKIIGFGGTSAGSMVALMGALTKPWPTPNPMLSPLPKPGKRFLTVTVYPSDMIILDRTDSIPLIVKE